MGKRLGVLMFLGALIFTFKFGLNFQREVALDDYEEVEEAAPQKKSTRKKTTRTPSSLPKEVSRRSSPDYRTRDRETEKFDEFNRDLPAPEESNPSATSSSGIVSQSSSSYYESSPARRDRSPSGSRREYDDSQENRSSEDVDSSTPAVINGSAGYFPPPSTTDDNETGGSFSSENPVCSASIGSGSYSSPISVSLTCTTTSSISYCLSEGTCCDPSSGSLYSGPIPVGAEAKTYCLSFIGTDADGNESVIVENSYTFNPSLPDIQVAYAKKVYQTTQLDGLLSLTSADFGTNQTSAGVLNLKSHDPVANALTTCEDIVENSGFLSPIQVLPPTDVSGMTPAQQIDVFLDTSRLTYGDNFISSYVQNTAFGNVYSCSTTKLVLEDFPFFETISSNATINGTAVMEFSGGFASIGFFEEPEPVISREPAGLSTENQTGQELRSGLFGVFY